MLFNQGNETFVFTENTKSRFSSQYSEDIHPKDYPTKLESDEDNKTLSETENTLHLLEQFNLDPKVFCFAEKNDINTTFEVKSNHWNWIVKPISLEKIEEIPRNYLAGLKILKEANVLIRAIALATPVNKEKTSDVIHVVCTEEINKLVRITQNTLILIAKLVKSITSISPEPHSSKHKVSMQALPDPVLLVRLTNTWIEIGRW